MPFSVVHITTSGRGLSVMARSARRQVMPSISGMFQSSRTMSGTVVRQNSTAASAMLGFGRLRSPGPCSMSAATRRMAREVVDHQAEMVPCS